MKKVFKNFAVIAFAGVLFLMTGCKDDVKVNGVSTDPKALTVEIGKQGNITATVSPSDAENKSVQWITRNSGIATINNQGTVTGVAEGETFVLVTTVDGNFKDSALVTVVKPTTGPQHLPSKITYTETTPGAADLTMEMNVQYNTNKQITRIGVGKNATDYGVFEFVYNSFGQLTKQVFVSKVPSKLSYTTEYAYSENSVTATQVDQNQMNIQTKYELDANGRVQKIDYIGSLSFVNFYYDSNDNLKKAVNSSQNEFNFTYDEMNGIFKSINLPNWFFFDDDNAPFAECVNLGFHVANNVTEWGTSWFDNQFTYIYNADNYPVQIDLTTSGSKGQNGFGHPLAKRLDQEKNQKSTKATTTYHYTVTYDAK